MMARHKVAANILMLLMILSGLWGLANLNRQFLPTFTLNAVLVTVAWPGAAAPNVDAGIAQPIELALKELENVKKLSIVSRPGSAEARIEVIEGGDPQAVVEDVNRILDQLNTLPSDAKDPVVRRAQHYERMGRFVLTTEGAAAELWNTARQIERELLNFGIDKITTSGLPQEEISIEVPIERLVSMQLSLPQIADTINSLSRNVSAGRFGRDDGARELRSLAQRQDPLDAAVEAAGQRLRAVMVTSLTTIGGLMPIMFETSRQAQFLIPMAVSLIFGLALGAFLILLVVPSLVVMSENLGTALRPSSPKAPRAAL